jgi:predicted amidohydrolase YtcJ
VTTQAADLILHNANVLTMNPRQPRAELVAMGAGEIVWVGSSGELDLFTGRPKLIDCEGKTVVPGFNDAHAHVFAYASMLVSIDVSPASVASIADICGKIKQEAAAVPRGTWLRANGYNEFYLRERRHPTRRDLDEAAPHHPVKLTHRSLHACVLNSLALSIAGITVETPDPPGGLVDRELETGEPSGVLFGMNSYINEQVMPPLTEDELRQGLRLADRSFISSGITSIQDATVRNGLAQWSSFLKMKQEGKLSPRITMMVGSHALQEMRDANFRPGFGDDWLRLGPVKIVLDETGGRLNPTQEELNEVVLASDKAGFQVAMHAVEEGTVEAAAGALEHCLRASPRLDPRHRVEHCSVCTPGLLKRLQDVGALVVTQPAFIYHSGERYLNEVPGPQLPWLYRVRSFVEGRLRPAASSDCPVVPCNPLVGIYAAVTRRAESGQVLSPNEAVAAGDALRMYTLGGACASFEEQGKGSVESGKLADIAVLSADPTAVEPEAIREIQVEKTVIGGEVVWEC